MDALQLPLEKITAAILYKYALDNQPQPPTLSPTDLDPSNPAPFIKFQNYRQLVSQLYGGTGPNPILGDNRKRIDLYADLVNEWEQHNKHIGVPPPAFPVNLEIITAQSFETYWNALNLFYDPNSPFYHDQDFYDKVNAYPTYRLPLGVWYSPVQILPPEQTPQLPANGDPIGKQVSVWPPLFLQATSGHNIGENYSDKATGAEYILINPNAVLNDPTKFEWLRTK